MKVAHVVLRHNGFPRPMLIQTCQKAVRFHGTICMENETKTNVLAL